MIVRLWTNGFHKLLESLRHASFTSQLAFEHFYEFISYAYAFYGALLEDPNLNLFKSAWLEALGDLARYRMVMTAMVNDAVGGLTREAITDAADAGELSSKALEDDTGMATSASPKSVSDRPAEYSNVNPSQNVDITAVHLLDVEPEKERWRNIARHWYGAGLAELPDSGKLHHHLGLLSRGVEGEELRCVYHFVKGYNPLFSLTYNY
jgi:hypothetical protein